MAIDPQIEMAIRDSVLDANQPEILAKKLIKWLENSMEGTEDPLDKSSYELHLDLIFQTMDVHNTGDTN